jgi:hypothetical protein
MLFIICTVRVGPVSFEKYEELGKYTIQQKPISIFAFVTDISIVWWTNNVELRGSMVWSTRWFRMRRLRVVSNYIIHPAWASAVLMYQAT